MPPESALKTGQPEVESIGGVELDDFSAAQRQDGLVRRRSPGGWLAHRAFLLARPRFTATMIALCAAGLSWMLTGSVIAALLPGGLAVIVYWIAGAASLSSHGRRDRDLVAALKNLGQGAHVGLPTSDELSRAVEEAAFQIERRLQDEVRRAREKLADARRDFQRESQQRLAEIEDLKKRLDDLLETSTQQRQNWEQEKADWNVRCRELDGELARARRLHADAIHAWDVKNSALERELENRLRELENCSRELENCSRELENCSRELENRSRELEAAKSDGEQARGRLREQSERNRELEEEARAREEHMASLESRIGDLERSLEAERVEHGAARDALESMRTELAEVLEQLRAAAAAAEAHREEASELESSRDELERTLGEERRQGELARQQLAAAEERLRATEDQVRSAEERLRTTEHQLRAAEASAESRGKEAAQLESRVADLARSLEREKGEHQGTCEALESMRRELAASEERLRAGEEQLRTAREQLQAGEERHRTAEERLRAAEAAAEEEGKEVAELESRRQELEETLEEERKEGALARQEKAAAQERLRAADETTRTLEVRIASFESRVADLSEALECEKQKHSREKTAAESALEKLRAAEQKAREQADRIASLEDRLEDLDQALQSETRERSHDKSRLEGQSEHIEAAERILQEREQQIASLEMDLGEARATLEAERRRGEQDRTSWEDAIQERKRAEDSLREDLEESRRRLQSEIDARTRREQELQLEAVSAGDERDTISSRMDQERQRWSEEKGELIDEKSRLEEKLRRAAEERKQELDQHEQGITQLDAEKRRAESELHRLQERLESRDAKWLEERARLEEHVQRLERAIAAVHERTETDSRALLANQTGEDARSIELKSVSADLKMDLAEIQRQFEAGSEAYSRLLEEKNRLLELNHSIAAHQLKFFDNVSGKLRGPLHVAGKIAGELAGASAAGAPAGARGDDLTQKARRICTYLRRLDRLVDQVVDLSRLQASRWQTVLSDVDVPRLLNSAVAEFRDAIEEKMIDVQLDLPSDLPPVRIDERLLARTVRELLSNAVRFVDAKGRIRLQARVAIAEERGGERLTLVVADNGPGIAPADQERVFRPFEQAQRQPRQKTGEGGSGLGLTLVRRYVDLMKGSVQLESEPGAETVFTVEAPVARAAATS